LRARTIVKLFQFAAPKTATTQRMANLCLAPGRRALSGFCGIGFLMRDGLHLLPRTLEHGFGRVAGPGSGISNGEGERSLLPHHSMPSLASIRPMRSPTARSESPLQPFRITRNWSSLPRPTWSVLHTASSSVCATMRSIEGAASAPKFARKTSKPCSSWRRFPVIRSAPFAPENDPSLKLDHADSDLQALQKPSTNLGILKGRHSLTGSEAVEYFHRHNPQRSQETNPAVRCEKRGSNVVSTR